MHPNNSKEARQNHIAILATKKRKNVANSCANKENILPMSRSNNANVDRNSRSSIFQDK